MNIINSYKSVFDIARSASSCSSSKTDLKRYDLKTDLKMYDQKACKTHTHTHTHTKQNKINFLPGPACPESQQRQECSLPGEESDRIQCLFTKLRTICCGNISANWSFFFFPLSFWKMILEGNSKPTKRCLRRCLCPRRPILGFQGGKNSPPTPTPRAPPQIASKKPRKKRLLVLL
jgi:hypothetical protein